MRFTAAHICVSCLLVNVTLFAGVPQMTRFVSDERVSGGILKVVSWEQLGDTFTVKLSQGSSEPQVTTLLDNAKCRVVSSGYHCFIKPVKRPGLLTTDVIFAITSPSQYDISTIVLINGSFTATHLIGRAFVEQAAFF